MGVLFLGGFNLILVQFFLVREVNAILHGTEIVILLTAIAYFTGYSVGYGLAGRFSRSTILRLAWPVWAFHLTLPFSIRYLAGAAVVVAPGLAMLVLLFLLAFGISAFYSLLLPHLIDRDARQLLVPYYSIELVGAVCTVAVLIPSGLLPWLPAMAYQVGMAALVLLLTGRTRRVLAVGVPALLIYALSYSAVSYHSAAFVYRWVHDWPEPSVLYSVNSPYQKVEVIQSKGRRQLYLDGLRYYGGSRLTQFNTFLSGTPAIAMQPEEVLIVGSGSMESVGNVSRYCKRVTTVELDRAVINASRIHFADVNHLDQMRNWELVIDDAKHFLGSTDRTFDLIIMDVPAPFAVQTGLLHSVEFYALAKSRLRPNGVLSVSLSGKLRKDRKTPTTVTAALLRVFPEMLVINPRTAHKSFVFASEDLPFTKVDLNRTLTRQGEDDFTIYDRRQASAIVGDREPISLNNLGYAVSRSWRRVRNRYFKLNNDSG